MAFHFLHTFKRREAPIFILTLLIALLVSFTSPAFFSGANLMDMLKANSVLFISSLGMLFILLTGGIDVSIASALAVNTMLGGYFLTNYSGSPVLLFLVNLSTGVMLSLINGFVLIKYKIPAVVMSLGMLSLLFGILLYVSNGNWITGFPKSFVLFGKYRFFHEMNGLPIQFFFVLISLFLSFAILQYTTLGRSIYAVGGNPISANRFGINAPKVLAFAYLCQGVLQGIASFTHASIVGQADPNAFIGFELEVIAVAVIGGVRIRGGKGSPWNIIVGALFIAVLNNGLTLARIPTFWQKILLGMLIIISVTVDQMQSTRAKKNAPKIAVADREVPV